MPYIITTTNPSLRAAFNEAGGRGVDLAERIDDAESDLAVATLEEAREVAVDALGVRSDRVPPDELDRKAVNDSVGEVGGVIGPLHDGYIIDVRRLTWAELHSLTPLFAQGSFADFDGPVEDIIAAYNERSD